MSEREDGKGRTFGPCRQCESAEVNVRFHDGEPHCKDCRRDHIDAPSCRYTNCGQATTYAPHLQVTCARCAFSWVEQPSLAPTPIATSSISTPTPATEERSEP